MIENNITTGINNFIKEKPVEAIIFLDNTCPKCGKKLELDTRILNKIYIAIRYICKYCGYICPIKYDIHNNICNSIQCDEPKPSPLYDDSISKFIKNFGNK